jgi:glycosyltransferase involved in cell wall biosynthesis
VRDCEILTINLEGYGKGGLGTIAYDLHESLVREGIPSVLIASGNPRALPNVLTLREDDYASVPEVVRHLRTRYRLVAGRNELAALSLYLDDLVLMTGGTAYLQEWLEAGPERTALDFVRFKHAPKVPESSRLGRERIALEKARKILSPPGLNTRILRKAYPEFAHKIFEVPQVFRRLAWERPWKSRGIDLIGVAQWKDRGIDRDIKGYRLLAEVVRRLKENRFRTVVVGDVPFPLEGVTHTGWIDHEEALALMGNAKVFVSPSRNECYSQAIVEAFHLGCNVVLSRNVEPHGFCHPDLIARYDGRSFSEKIEKALARKYPNKSLPSPEDSLNLLMTALHA